MKKVKKVADILKFIIKEQGLTRVSYQRLSLIIGNAQRSYWGELRKKFERTQEITDDISPWVEIASAITTTSTGGYTLPSNYGAFAGLYLGEDEIEVDVVKESAVGSRKNSELIVNSATRPFAVFRGPTLQFYPKQALSPIMLVYIKNPTDPSIGYSVASNRETYIDGTTTDLECKDTSIDEIIRRAALEIGVAISDQEVKEYVSGSMALEQKQSR